MTSSTLSDSSGNYQFVALNPGGSYTVTPTKAALLPGASGINTVDVIATQRHFLNLGTLSGCRLTAADVTGDSAVNTVDVIAIQRFFLGSQNGTANAGKYRFSPASRAYPQLVTDQSDQNYDALIFGDVASGFVHRPEGPPQSEQNASSNADDSSTIVMSLSLPNVTVPASISKFIIPVRVSAIDPNKNLVGFQGEFTFDPSVVTFQDDPVQQAGLTSNNWNVSANVLAGLGPIRTLRISAFSNDFVPLSGDGVLFELRMLRVNPAPQATQLIWATAPNEFIFIDSDLKTHEIRKGE